MKRVHELKIWPEFYKLIVSGVKTCELRRNDRQYDVGDKLLLREYEPINMEYTGKMIYREITHVLHGAGVGCIEPLQGLSIGFVILSLKECA